MNNFAQFTKDELIDLRSGIRLLINEDHCDSSYTREIRSLEDKIQSMIDNYDKQKPAIVFVRGESRDISEFYDE